MSVGTVVAVGSVSVSIVRGGNLGSVVIIVVVLGLLEDNATIAGVLFLFYVETSNVAVDESKSEGHESKAAEHNDHA